MPPKTPTEGIDSILETTPEQNYTTHNGEIEQSRRKFLRLFGLGFGAAAAMAANLPQSEALAQHVETTEKEQKELIIEEIKSIWGVRIAENPNSPATLEQLREVKDILVLFPPGFDGMLKTHLYDIGEKEKLEEVPDLTIYLNDSTEDLGETVREGIYTPENRTIRLSGGATTLPLKKRLIHEIGHAIHECFSNTDLGANPLIYGGVAYQEHNTTLAQVSDFHSYYDTKNKYELFAESLAEILLPDDTNATLDVSERYLRNYYIKEMLLILTKGKMDKGYFSDLKSGKVTSEDYWENKKSAETWIEKVAGYSIYMTDLDKENPEKTLPAVITSGSFDYKNTSDSTTPGDKKDIPSLAVGGRNLEFKANGSTLEMVIDGKYRSILAIPKEGKITYVSVDTPAVKKIVWLTTRNGEIKVEDEQTQVKYPEYLQKDNYAPVFIDELLRLTKLDLENLIIAGIPILSTSLVALAGNSAAQLATKNFRLFGQNSLNLAMSRRALMARVLASVATGVSVGLGFESEISQSPARRTEIQKAKEKMKHLLKLKTETMKDFFRHATDFENWEKAVNKKLENE